MRGVLGATWGILLEITGMHLRDHGLRRPLMLSCELHWRGVLLVFKAKASRLGLLCNERLWSVVSLKRRREK